MRACLESVAWADEVIVVDAESHDKTVHDRARVHRSRVRAALAGLRGAEELRPRRRRAATGSSRSTPTSVVSPELRDEIRAMLAGGGRADGYRVPRRNVFWGRWVRHGGLYPDWQLRLFRRGRGRFVERAVHESVRVDGTRGPAARATSCTGPIATSRTSSRAPTATRRWPPTSGWPAGGRRVRATDLVVRPRGRFLVHVRRCRRGFLDGVEGILLAVPLCATMCSCARPRLGREGESRR